MNELESKFDRLMLDSGSQSTACRPSFAPDYEVDDTEKAKLCDILEHQIESYGKKIMDVKFPRDDKQEDIPCSLFVDVSDVDKDVASMARMLRDGFAMQFTKKGHKCWMEHKGRQSKIKEDDLNSEAPLFYLNMKIQPIPENGGSSACDREARSSAEQEG